MAMGRPVVVAWSEDAATLGRLYRSERDNQVRPRLQALWLIQRGRTVREAATLVGVHERTVQEWLGWYRAGGLAAVRGHRRAGKGRAAYLAPDQQAQLVRHTASGAVYTAQDAVEWVEAQFGVRYTRDGIYGLLRRLGVRPKVPRPMNPKTSIEAQDAWKRGAWSPPSPTRA
jgi:transposase